MIETRLFEHDPLTKTTRWFHYDHNTGDVTIESQFDVTDVVELNKELARVNTGRYGDGWHRVASLPLSIWYDLKRRGIIDDPNALRKWLNDPDNRFFRTKEWMV